MNRRHATSLVGLGWYLMMPPTMSDGTVVTSAPLSQWLVSSSHDSADDCESVRLMASGWMPYPDGRRASHTPLGDKAACISSDNPGSQNDESRTAGPTRRSDPKSPEASVLLSVDAFFKPGSIALREPEKEGRGRRGDGDHHVNRKPRPVTVVGEPAD
jgi:hypothetical protein